MSETNFRLSGRWLVNQLTSVQVSEQKPLLMDRELLYVAGKGFKVGNGVDTADLLSYISSDWNIRESEGVVLQGNKTPEENYQDLVNAYAVWISKNCPGDRDNPYKILLMPGDYRGADGTKIFTMTQPTQFANVCPSIIAPMKEVLINIKTFNLDTESPVLYGLKGDIDQDMFSEAMYVECEGSSYSFSGSKGSNSKAGGLYINCKGGSYTFGGGANGFATGRFYNCEAGNYSFGNICVGAQFFDCTGLSFCFGQNRNEEQGDEGAWFYRCKAESDSFNAACGYYQDCNAKARSFNQASMTDEVFPTTFVRCVAEGKNCFSVKGGFGNIYGSFYNCKADFSGWGAEPGETLVNMTGYYKCYYCVGGAGSFQNKEDTAKVIYCIKEGEIFNG